MEGHSKGKTVAQRKLEGAPKGNDNRWLVAKLLNEEVSSKLVPNCLSKIINVVDRTIVRRRISAARHEHVEGLGALSNVPALTEHSELIQQRLVRPANFPHQISYGMAERGAPNRRHALVGELHHRFFMGDRSPKAAWPAYIMNI